GTTRGRPSASLRESHRSGLPHDCNCGVRGRSQLARRRLWRSRRGTRTARGRNRLLHRLRGVQTRFVLGRTAIRLLPAAAPPRRTARWRPRAHGREPKSVSPPPESVLLYDSPVSGNCYKVRLLLAHLGIPYERRTMDVVDRSNRPEVLGGLNPALRVPTLVLDDGRPLAESGAILWYLGEGSRFVPDDSY